MKRKERIMDQKVLDKITKFVGKGKSGKIISLLNGKKADADLKTAALEALAKIKDEDAVNAITHCLDAEDVNVKLAACKAAVSIGSDYLVTQVRNIMQGEKSADIKAKIMEIIQNR